MKKYLFSLSCTLAYFLTTINFVFAGDPGTTGGATVPELPPAALSALIAAGGASIVGLRALWYRKNKKNFKK